MKLVDCEPRRHSAPILAIFNEAIANSTALYDYKPRTAESMVGWFEAKAKGRYPVIGIEDDAGDAHGLRQLRNVSRLARVQVHRRALHLCRHAASAAMGIGRRLLEAVVDAAVKQDYHVMVGGIDASNAVSIRLHERLGFTHCGTIAQAGFKFGRWLDLAFYQKILATPASPVDG